jgi:hypothetical protein
MPDKHALCSIEIRSEQLRNVDYNQKGVNQKGVRFIFFSNPNTVQKGIRFIFSEQVHCAPAPPFGRSARAEGDEGTDITGAGRGARTSDPLITNRFCAKFHNAAQRGTTPFPRSSCRDVLEVIALC